MPSWFGFGSSSSRPSNDNPVYATTGVNDYVDAASLPVAVPVVTVTDAAQAQPPITPLSPGYAKASSPSPTTIPVPASQRASPPPPMVAAEPVPAYIPPTTQQEQNSTNDVLAAPASAPYPSATAQQQQQSSSSLFSQQGATAKPAATTTTIMPATGAQGYQAPPHQILLGRRPTKLKQCPVCNQYNVKTRVQTAPNWITWLACVAILVICWPLCFIPLVVECAKQTDHYCTKCNHKVGQVSPFQDCCVRNQRY